MGPDELNLNSAPDDALSAGVAENLVATAPGIELPEADFAVPIYQPAGPRAATSEHPSPQPTTNNQQPATVFNPVR